MKKVVYIMGTMECVGGIERILSDKINHLSVQSDWRIYLICVTQSKNKKNQYNLSDKVTQFNLECAFVPKTTIAKNPLLFLYLWLKWRIKVFVSCRGVLKAIKPDLTIVTPAFLPEYFLFAKGKRVIESHTDKRKVCYDKFPIYGKTILKIAERRCDMVVSLTEGDKRLWNHAKRVEVIPNFTLMQPVRPCDIAVKRAIAVGRLVEQKGFDMLIDAWSTVADKHRDWALDIYGNGPLKKILEQRIIQAHLTEKVFLRPATPHIAEAYSEHSFFILSSRYEGFALVVLEAMACGLPVVSFDCPFGPSDIIENGKDGILVEYHPENPSNTNVRKLALAICRMIENGVDDRAKMGKAAMDKVRRFDKETIMHRWCELFESL